MAEPTNDGAFPLTAEQRAVACVENLSEVLRRAQRVAGKGATVSCSDLLRLIEAFQRGELDGGAPITGPSYPRDRQ